MGEDVEDFDLGGGEPKGIGEIFQGIGAIFQGGGTGVFAVRGRYMGPDPPYGAGPDQISAQVRATDHREAAEEAGGMGVGTIPRWQRQLRKQVLGRWGHTSQGGRIWSRNILRHN